MCGSSFSDSIDTVPSRAIISQQAMGFAFNCCRIYVSRQLMTPTSEVLLQVGVWFLSDHPREDCPEGFLLAWPKPSGGTSIS